jgi:hypothetical protein
MNEWLKILEAFRDGKFPDYYYGLTPRFIIGVCQTPIGKRFESSELAFEATKKMFNEMQTFNRNEVIVVSNKCGIHNGPVMSLSTVRWTEVSIATSLEEIWERYGEEIIQGNYHISSAERKIVEEIFIS